MNALAHLCEHLSDRYDFEEDYSGEWIYGIFGDVAPSLNDTLTHCMWLNKDGPCAKMFVPVLTENGLCFTYNALNSHEIYTNE